MDHRLFQQSGGTSHYGWCVSPGSCHSETFANNPIYWLLHQFSSHSPRSRSDSDYGTEGKIRNTRGNLTYFISAFENYILAISHLFDNNSSAPLVPHSLGSSNNAHRIHAHFEYMAPHRLFCVLSVVDESNPPLSFSSITHCRKIMRRG